MIVTFVIIMKILFLRYKIYILTRQIMQYL